MSSPIRYLLFGLAAFLVKDELLGMVSREEAQKQEPEPAPGSSSADEDDMIDAILLGKNSIPSELQVEEDLHMGDMGSTYWNAKYVWKIKNNSKTQSFTIDRLRSSFILAGYQCTAWVPGNKNSITLGPGKEQTFVASVVNKVLYNKTQQGEIREAIRKAFGYSSFGSVPDQVVPPTSGPWTGPRIPTTLAQSSGLSILLFNVNSGTSRVAKRAEPKYIPFYYHGSGLGNSSKWGNFGYNAGSDTAFEE